MRRSLVRSVLPFLALAATGLIVFRLLPIALSLGGSFFRTGLTGETSFAGLRNYVDLFIDDTFWHSVRTTILFNLVINPLQLVLAMGLALLVLKPTRFIGFYRSAYFVPMTLSIALTAVLWAILLDPNLGPVNAILEAIGIGRQPFFRSAGEALGSLVWLASWKGVGYWMLFLLAGLLAIPGELYEAARLDGAGYFSSFRHITLPLMRRPMAFVLVAATAANFTFFAPVYIITNGGPDGATDLLMFRAFQSAFTYSDFGRSLALASMVLALLLLVAMVELRLFSEQD